MPSKRIQTLINGVKVQNGEMTQREPVAVGYSRVSHRKSFDKGDSLPAQALRIKAYYEANLKPEGVKYLGTRNDGTNISAYTTSFRKRPAGSKILQELQPGDHLIIDKVDRIWRSIPDMVSMVDYFKNNEITIHIVSFLDGTIKTGTPLGDWSMQMFVMTAQLESAVKSERIREGLAYNKRMRGSYLPEDARPPGTTPYKKKMPNGKVMTLLKWDEQQRAIMKEIVRLRLQTRHRMVWGIPWGPTLHGLIRRFTNEVYGHKYGDKTTPALVRKWQKMFKYECAYQYLEITDPMKIPPRDIIQEASRQFRRVELGKRKAKSKVTPVSKEELLSVL